MSYTKPDQTGFNPNLDASSNEFVVQLDDTSNYVAVLCITGLEPTSGNPTFLAKARVVDSTGKDLPDANGAPITSAFSHTSNPTEISLEGGVGGVQKQCLLAVLGEATSLWNDTIHQSVMQNASIRTNIATAQHVGPAPAGTLL